MTCSEIYYPEWSSQGMRGVKCNRPAKKMLVQGSTPPRPVCGIHARRHAPYGGRFEPIPGRSGSGGGRG